MTITYWHSPCLWNINGLHWCDRAYIHKYRLRSNLLDWWTLFNHNRAVGCIPKEYSCDL